MVRKTFGEHFMPATKLFPYEQKILIIYEIFEIFMNYFYIICFPVSGKNQKSFKLDEWIFDN